MTLDERAVMDKVSSLNKCNSLRTPPFFSIKYQTAHFLSAGLHRKVSSDILEIWKKNIRPLYDKEMQEIVESKVKESKLEEKWFFRACAGSSLPVWTLVVAGYLPPVIVVLAYLFTRWK